MEDSKDPQRDGNSLPPGEHLGCPFDSRGMPREGHLVIIRPRFAAQQQAAESRCLSWLHEDVSKPYDREVSLEGETGIRHSFNLGLQFRVGYKPQNLTAREILRIVFLSGGNPENLISSLHTPDGSFYGNAVESGLHMAYHNWPQQIMVEWNHEWLHIGELWHRSHSAFLTYMSALLIVTVLSAVEWFMQLII